MIHMNAKVVGVGTTFLVILIFGAVVLAPQYTNRELSVKSDNHRSRST